MERMLGPVGLGHGSMQCNASSSNVMVGLV
jgi:hypothetical protein